MKKFRFYVSFWSWNKLWIFFLSSLQFNCFRLSVSLCHSFIHVTHAPSLWCFTFVWHVRSREKPTRDKTETVVLSVGWDHRVDDKRIDKSHASSSLTHSIVWTPHTHTHNVNAKEKWQNKTPNTRIDGIPRGIVMWCDVNWIRSRSQTKKHSLACRPMLCNTLNM